MTKREQIGSLYTPEMLDQFAHFGVYSELIVAANHKRTSPETLEFLARNRFTDVRRDVAANRNTPVSVLVSLANDESAWVLRRLVENKNLPEPIRFMIFLEHPYL